MSEQLRGRQIDDHIRGILKNAEAFRGDVPPQRFGRPALRTLARGFQFHPDYFGSCAVTALCVGPDGRAYGATSGKCGQLFCFETVTNLAIHMLGALPNGESVKRSLAMDRAGALYAGTIPDNYLEKNDWESYAGGRLYSRKVNVFTAWSENLDWRYNVDPDGEFADLGIPAPHEGVFSMAIDRDRSMLYGISFPNGIFWSYAIESGDIQHHGRLFAEKMPLSFSGKPKTFGRAIFVHADGRAYCSGRAGELYCYDPGDSVLRPTGCMVPTVKERQKWVRAECFAPGADGMIYGGTSDGFLFRYCPETDRLDNLGKPLPQMGLPGLVARGHTLYGIAGEKDGYARVFSYDTRNGTVKDWGNFAFIPDDSSAWIATEFDAMVADGYGNFILGELGWRAEVILLRI